jgi:hypothetical protein
MSEEETLGDDAVSLLLTLLEADEPAIVGDAAALVPAASGPLIARGLLVEAGHDDVIGVETADGEELVTLAPVGDQGDLGYLNSQGGFVIVPKERLIRRQVDMPRVLAVMFSELDLPQRWTVTALSADVLWELPPLRIGRSAGRHTVWFARRLADPAAASQVVQAIARRPPVGGFLILTSTPEEQVAIALPSTAMLVCVRDVLRRPDDLALHAGILEGRIQGLAGSYDHVEPAWLSPDGKTLRFKCGTQFSFSGAAHIRALRKLIDGQRQRRGVASADLSIHGLENLFGHKRWKDLKPFLDRRHDGWHFKR